MTKRLAFFILILTSALMACSNPERGPVAPGTFEDGIIGGEPVAPKNLTAQYGLLLYDKKTDTFCTGLLVANNLVLSAAHCIPENLENLIVAFGTKPRTGAYKLRQANFVVKHPDFVADRKGRNDLAVLRLSEAAPSGARPLNIPGDDFPLEKGLQFTALGYGRTQGTHLPTENGELRSVTLQIAELSPDRRFFMVDQTQGKGICNGDSGGPAIMRYQDQDYVVGVASAIFWTTPKLGEDQKRDEPSKTDLCSEKSIYMNIQQYRQWLTSVLLQLSN